MVLADELRKAVKDHWDLTFAGSFIERDFTTEENWFNCPTPMVLGLSDILNNQTNYGLIENPHQNLPKHDYHQIAIETPNPNINPAYRGEELIASTILHLRLWYPLERDIMNGNEANGKRGADRRNDNRTNDTPLIILPSELEQYVSQDHLDLLDERSPRYIHFAKHPGPVDICYVDDPKEVAKVIESMDIEPPAN